MYKDAVCAETKQRCGMKISRSRVCVLLEHIGIIQIGRYKFKMLIVISKVTTKKQ